jgi:hypothetical protein
MSAHNAIGSRTCGTCKNFHNPQNEPMGICIARPPTPMIVGMQPMPAPAIVDPKKVPQQMVVPIVMGFHPPRSPEHGCGEHQRDAANLNSCLSG